MATATSRIDSPRNCTISCPREAPTTFLSATSLARCPARAVARLTKLMLAITRISTATIEKVATVRASLPGVSARSCASPRCTLLTGTSSRLMMSACDDIWPPIFCGGMILFSQAGSAALIASASAPGRSFT